MVPTVPFRTRLGLTVIRLAAPLVPASHRSAWRREWEAEIRYALRRREERGGSLGRILARSLAAVPHAWSLRRDTMTMAGWRQDIRFAMRLLRRRPVASAVTLATLALGIGANAAMFSVVNQSLVRPLPYGDPGRLVVAWETLPSEHIFENTPAASTLDTWRRRAHSAAVFAAMTSEYLTMTGAGEPDRLQALRVDYRLLSVLGAAPARGRGFDAREDRPGGPKVALLSDRLWTTRFARDPSVVGRTVRLNGDAFEIVGVLPPRMPLPAWEADIWVPLALTADERASGSRILWVVARLAPGATAGALGRELNAAIATEADGTASGIGASVVPLDADVRGWIRPDLLLVFVVTAVVLLIACANVATMLLALNTSRVRELAVRAALGAGRGRIARQLAIESLALGLIGGALGLALAVALVRLLGALLPDALAPVVRYQIDGRVLAFGLAASIATAVLFAVAPVAAATRRMGSSALRAGARSTAGGWRSMRGVLVLVEVALALVLLAGAGLVVRAFARLSGTSFGVATDHVLTFQLDRAETDPARRVQFYRTVETTLAALPGVTSVAMTNGLPLRFFGGGSGFTPSPPAVAGGPVFALYRVVSPGFFRTLGVPLITGGSFTGRERAGVDPIAIVSRAYALKAWGTTTTVGRQVKWADSPWFRVIGVVGDVGLSNASPSFLTVYFSYSQVPSIAPSDFAVRTAGTPTDLVAAVRSAVRGIDPDQPVSSVLSFDDLVAQSLGRRRFTATLVASFAALALLLAAIGIYGVMSFLVGRRTREIGIRIALGATHGQVRRQMIVEALVVVVGGVAVGAATSVWVARAAAGTVPGLTAPNARVLAGAAVVLLAAALVACDVPARRALRVDPAVTLREE